jgi:hypothetical protein
MMRQQYTVTVLDPQTKTVLAKQTTSGLVLPLVVAPAKVRMTSAVRGGLNALGIDAFIAGLSIGQANPAVPAVDWHVAAYRRPGPSHPCQQFNWIPVEDALSSDCVLPFQAVALRRAADAQVNEGHQGWGSPKWLADIEEWVRETLGLRSSPSVWPLEQFTATGLRTVFRLDTECGPVFFKAVRHAPFTEAEITQRLWAHSPMSFPRTIRFCPDRHWWLTSPVGGTSLGRGFTQKDLSRVLRNLCDTQIATIDLVPGLQHAQAQAWTGPMLRESSSRLLSEWSRSCDQSSTIHELCEQFSEDLEPTLDALDRMPIPVTWVHCDLAPSNVFLDAAERTIFVDLDKSGVGKPIVGLANLLDLAHGDIDGLLEVLMRSWRASPAGARQIPEMLRRVEPYVRATLQWQWLSPRFENGELLEPTSLLLDVAMRHALMAMPNPRAQGLAQKLTRSEN